MGIHLEQQLRQAFLLFPRNVKTFFENSCLTREKKEAALPALLLTCRGWLYMMLHKCTRSLCALGSTPTHRHTTNPGTCSKPLTGSVHTHRLFLPLHHSARLQPQEMCPAGSSRELLWTSAWGLMFLQEQGHGSRQDDNTDLPKLPQHWWHSTKQLFLHTGFLPAISHSLQRAVKTHTANFIPKVILVGEQEPEGKAQLEGAKYQESSMAPVILVFLLYPLALVGSIFFNEKLITSY